MKLCVIKRIGKSDVSARILQLSVQKGRRLTRGSEKSCTPKVVPSVRPVLSVPEASECSE